MKKLFENTTSYSLEEYEKFLQFHNKKYNFGYIFYTLFFLMMFIICTVITICNGYWLYSVLFFIISFCFLFWRIFYPYHIVRKETDSNKIKNELKNTYSFYNNCMILKNDEANIKLRYYRFYKVFETEDNFYLYIDKIHSFIISKNGFSLGTPEDFSKFINKKWFFNI